MKGNCSRENPAPSAGHLARAAASLARSRAEEDSRWRTYREEHFAARSLERLGTALTQGEMRREMDLGRMTRMDKLVPGWTDHRKHVRAYRWKDRSGRSWTVAYNTRDRIFITIY